MAMSLRKTIFFFSVLSVLAIPHVSFAADSKGAPAKKQTATTEKKKSSPIVLNTAVRYETHNTNMTEDFSYLYAVFTASAKLPNKSIATIHYMAKYNRQEKNNHSEVFGVTFVKIINENTWITAGYSPEKEFFPTEGSIEDTVSKISVSTMIPLSDQAKHIFELGYSKADGDFRRKTPSFSYEFEYKLKKNLKYNLSYLYSKASYDYPTLNIKPTLTTSRLGAGLFASLSPKDKLSLEYLHGDRSFSYYFKTDIKEDILRATYQKTY